MADRKKVLLVNILPGKKSASSPSFYKEVYAEFYQQLMSSAALDVQEVTKTEEMSKKLIEWQPKVILLVNEAPAVNKKIKESFLDFVDKGGLAVLFGFFPNMTRPNEFDSFFTSIGMNWRYGAYHRTDFKITEFGRALLQNSATTAVYSAKAVHVKGTTVEERLYCAAEGAHTQSHVFAPSSTNTEDTMAAFARRGTGAIAYVGDVNGENATTQLVLALCKVNLY